MAELVEGEVTSARAAIAGRYLGVECGERFAAERCSKPGVLLRLIPGRSAAVGPVEHPARLINPGQK